MDGCFGFFFKNNLGGALLRKLEGIDGEGKSLISLDDSMSENRSFFNFLQATLVKLRFVLISLKNSLLNTSSALHLLGENNLQNKA